MSNIFYFSLLKRPYQSRFIKLRVLIIYPFQGFYLLRAEGGYPLFFPHNSSKFLDKGGKRPSLVTDQFSIVEAFCLLVHLFFMPGYDQIKKIMFWFSSGCFFFPLFMILFFPMVQGSSTKVFFLLVNK